jgi:acetylglutamate kinase
MEKHIKKAEILIEALPYIQRLSGKTVVIKYGGNAMINDDLKNRVMEDITLLKFVGVNPIIVHGGGPEISKTLKIFDMDSRFVNGLRVTDFKTIKVAQMVLIGSVNKQIVSLINIKGGNAVGLSGIDGNMFECEQAYAEVNGEKTDIGYVGNIVKVNAQSLKMLANDQFIPVIAPIGVDKNGQSYNINADTAASALAAELKAEKLMMLTDTEGVKDLDGNIIYELSCSQAENLIKEGVISGGMIPKVEGCMEAIKAGVNRVHIIDGRIPHCLLLEIFTDTGIGTMITK